MKTTFILMLIYSPAGPYFNGFSFEVREDLQLCMAEIPKRIGEEVTTNRHWETQMMGPIPKVIGGLCAVGGLSPNAQ